MEEDEIEMSEEELQEWIKEEVYKNNLGFPDVLEKCNMLQSLLQRREKQAAQLLKLCESVAVCEAMIRKQYSLLGWEYVDTHSHNADADITDCGPSPQSICDSHHSENKDSHSQASNEPPCIERVQYSEHQDGKTVKSSLCGLKRNPVVVLTRLPECKLNVEHPSSPKNHCSENESLSTLDSDSYMNPVSDSSDSVNSTRNLKTLSKKKEKIDEKNKKPTPQVNSKTKAKSNALKTSASSVKSISNAKKGTAKPSPPKMLKDRNARTSGTKTAVPESSRNDQAKSKQMETSSTPKHKNDLVNASTRQAAASTSKASPSVPQHEICVNMHVLARRKDMIWQQAQVKKIHTKNDGTVEYKVLFENKEQSLVSGHHIAFDCMPKLEHLIVGTRVVFRHPGDKLQLFCGTLAEVPSRKNRMRFLVFNDAHKPFYVALPLLHVVCRPLPDPLDDIEDETHRNFMKDYLKKWPYTPQTQYKVGQLINAEFNGVLERCEVMVVDCSLIEVMFQRDQHKDWIYRGSIRLEHTLNLMNSMTHTKPVSR